MHFFEPWKAWNSRQLTSCALRPQQHLPTPSTHTHRQTHTHYIHQKASSLSLIFFLHTHTHTHKHTLKKIFIHEPSTPHFSSIPNLTLTINPSYMYAHIVHTTHTNFMHTWALYCLIFSMHAHIVHTTHTPTTCIPGPCTASSSHQLFSRAHAQPFLSHPRPSPSHSPASQALSHFPS